MYLNINILIEISSFLSEEFKYFEVISEIIKNNYKNFVKIFILKNTQNTGIILSENITNYKILGKIIEFYNIPVEGVILTQEEDEYGNFFNSYNNMINKKYIGYIENNNYNGEYKIFWKNGNVKTVKYLKDGIPYNSITGYSEDGVKTMELLINSDNEQNSLIKIYNGNGALFKEFLMKDINNSPENIYIFKNIVNFFM